MAIGQYLGDDYNTVTRTLMHFNNDARDLSGDLLHGTFINPAYGNGIIGEGSALFNGLNSFVEIDNNIPIRTFIYGTIVVWVKTTNNTLSQAIYHQFQEGSLDINNSSSLRIVGGKVFYQEYRKTGNASQSMSGNTIIPNNEWTQIVLTLDSNYLTYYINGVLDKSVVWTRLSTFYVTYNNMIGADNYLLNLATTNYFSGNIDELIVEDIIWTDSRIKKYYTYSKGMF